MPLPIDTVNDPVTKQATHDAHIATITKKLYSIIEEKRNNEIGNKTAAE